MPLPLLIPIFVLLVFGAIATKLEISDRRSRQNRQRRSDMWELILSKMKEADVSLSSSWVISDLVLWEYGDEIEFSVEGDAPDIKHAFDNKGDYDFKKGIFWKALGPSRIVLRTYDHGSMDMETVLQQYPQDIHILDLAYEQGFTYTKRSLVNISLNTRLESQRLRSRISNDDFQNVLSQARAMVDEHINQSHGMGLVAFDQELEKQT